MKIISIAARKGGVAKTTTAVNLAYTLARGGASVLLIDADVQGQCADLLGVPLLEDSAVFADWIGGREIGACALAVVDSPGLLLLPGDNKTIYHEHTLTADRALSLGRQLRDEAGALGVEWIVIDSPPRGAMQDWAILAADLVVVTAAANRLGAQMALETADLAGILGQSAGRLIDLLVLPVMAQAWTRDGKRWLDAIGVEFAGLLAPLAVPLAVVVAESAAAGVPIVEYRPRSRPALAYTALASAVVERAAVPVEVR